MQKALVSRYLEKSYIFFLTSGTGEIIRILKDNTGQAFEYLNSLISLYTKLVVCVFLGVTLIAMNTGISVFMIVVLLGEMLFLTKFLRPKVGILGWKYVKGSTLANKWILGLISGIKTIKVSNNGAYFKNMYIRYAETTVDIQRKNQALGKMPKLFIESVTVSSVLGYILFMVSRGSELSSLIPVLSAFAVAAMRLLPCVSNMTTDINSLRFHETALDNILDVLREEQAVAEDEKGGENSVAAEITFQNSVTLEHVTFAYPDTDVNIIEDACLSITRGQSVAIIGRSGVGKTTAVDVMLGLLKPLSGAVKCDGIDIETNMDSWLSHVAYIPQQIFIMDDTIKHNVALGIPEEEISDEHIWAVLKEAQLDEFVRSLPRGIETSVGERGVRLSGGQCQRLGIARALYTNPEILVFDEATSSLDNETEKAIMESIDSLKGRKTMIIIAHRLTTIENCDVVYKVENKKIVKVSI